MKRKQATFAAHTITSRVTDSHSAVNACAKIDKNRRHFLASTLALTGTTTLPFSTASAFLTAGAFSTASASVQNTQASTARYITTARAGPNEFNAILLDKYARALHRVPLPKRAHGAATYSRRGLVTVFARRPGYYMCCLNLKKPEASHFIHPSANRHFYGHGVYSPNGDYLLATENDIDTGRGVIGIYDVDQGYQRIGEMDTHGIGPHEIINIPDHPLVAVANGGIRTHPDTGRQKLNLHNMQPSLSIIDTRDGRLVGQHVLDDACHQLSIRHLTFTRNGNIWFAGQFEGGSDRLPDSLAGSISLRTSQSCFSKTDSRSRLQLSPMPQPLIERTKGYLSSIASYDHTVAITSSRGGIAFMLDDNSGVLIDTTAIPDCSGIAATKQNRHASDQSRQATATAAGIHRLDNTACRNANDDADNGGKSTANHSDASFIITSGSGDIGFYPDSPDMTGSHSNHDQWDNHTYAI